MIRSHLLAINSFLYYQLKLAAELDGIDSPETVAEAWLRERLDTRPEIGVLASRLSKAKKDITETWKAECAKEAAKAKEHARIGDGLTRADDDRIPGL